MHSKEQQNLGTMTGAVPIPHMAADLRSLVSMAEAVCTDSLGIPCTQPLMHLHSLRTRPLSRSAQLTAPTYSFASSKIGADRMPLECSSCTVRIGSGAGICSDFDVRMCACSKIGHGGCEAGIASCSWCSVIWSTCWEPRRRCGLLLS